MQLTTSLRTVLFLLLLAPAAASDAAILQYNGFIHDTSTNITRGNNLEWLRWNTTKNMSIEQAMADFAGEGWQLADSSQIVDLMQTFFPMYNWLDTLDENSQLGVTLSVADTDYYRRWGQLMGYTFDDGYSWTAALFGQDLDGDGLYRTVWGAYTDYEPVAGIASDRAPYTRQYQAWDVGIALVREIRISEPPIVFLMGWLALGWLLGRKVKG